MAVISYFVCSAGINLVANALPYTRTAFLILSAICGGLHWMRRVRKESIIRIFDLVCELSLECVNSVLSVWSLIDAPSIVAATTNKKLDRYISS